MDEFTLGLGVALLMVPALAPLAIVMARRSARLPVVTLVVLALLIGSMLAYGVAGVNYEDFDRPFPLWWTAGLGAAQVEAILLLVGLAILGWRTVRRHIRGSTSTNLVDPRGG